MVAAGSSATRSQSASQGSRPAAASARVRPTTPGSRWPVTSTSAGSASTQAPSPMPPRSAWARSAARRVRVAQAGPHGLGPAGRHRRGQQRAQHGRAGVVGVLVALGVDAVEAGRGQARQQPAAHAVGGPPGRLAVRHLEPHPGRPGDRHRLVQGRLQVGALVAHVGGVDAAVAGRHPGQRHQLRGAGVAARHVDQPARQPDGPGLERLVGQVGHPLRRPRPQPLVQPVGGQPQGPVPDQQGQVVGRPGPVQPPGQLPEPRRLDRHAPGQAAPERRPPPRPTPRPAARRSARSCPPPRWSRPGGA